MGTHGVVYASTAATVCGTPPARMSKRKAIVMSLRAEFGQEATLSVANRLANNGLRHKRLLTGPFVLYVHNCFTLVGLH
jgi:hypothetical protein